MSDSCGPEFLNEIEKIFEPNQVEENSTSQTPSIGDLPEDELIQAWKELREGFEEFDPNAATISD